MLLQGTKPGILGGIVKGFKGRKMAHTEDFIRNPKFNFSHLEGIFLKSPFPDPSPAVTDNQEAVELNIGSDLSTYLYTPPFCCLLLFGSSVESFSWLSCPVEFISLYAFGTDDIEIDDEPLPVESTSSHEFQNIKIGKSVFLIFI